MNSPKDTVQQEHLGVARKQSQKAVTIPAQRAALLPWVLYSIYLALHCKSEWDGTGDVVS